MPRFTFPLSPDGLAVQGLVGLNNPKSLALVQAGQPLPRPVSVRAVLDTGTDVTLVASPVIQPFGLVPVRRTTTQTAGGPVYANLYRMSLSVYGPTLAPRPLLVQPDLLLIMEMVVPLPNIDVLIGLDVLNECLLVHDGPGRQFILGF